MPFHVTISDHGGNVKADASDAVIGYEVHFSPLREGSLGVASENSRHLLVFLHTIFSVSRALSDLLSLAMIAGLHSYVYV